MSDFICDPETTDMIVDLATGATVSAGLASSGVVVPAAGLIKLIVRLSVNGVSIPDNDALTSTQNKMRDRGELPGLE